MASWNYNNPRKFVPLDLYKDDRSYQEYFNPNNLYSWNIDEKGEQEIIDITRKMLACYKAYMTSRKNIPVSSTKLIITGFIGILVVWWNNYVPAAKKIECQEATITRGNTPNWVVLFHLFKKIKIQHNTFFCSLECSCPAIRNWVTL